MKTKTLFFLSALISVVILILVGGVMLTYSFAKANGLALNTITNSPDTQTTNSEQVKVLMQRDATYQATIREANDRLAQANQNIALLQEQLRSSQSVSPSTSRGEGPYPITPEQAVQIAQQTSGGLNPEKAAELVNLAGNPAYEVAFAQGIVYVDPVNGQVIQNTLAAPEISQEEAIRIAENYLGKTSLLQVSETSYHDAKVFQISFRSGETVLVDMNGQIVMVQLQTIPIGGTRAEGEEDHED